MSKSRHFMKDSNSIVSAQIASPRALCIDAAFKNKIEKCRRIRELLKQQGIQCAVSAIILGSLGTVHSQAVKVLINQM